MSPVLWWLCCCQWGVEHRGSWAQQHAVQPKKDFAKAALCPSLHHSEVIAIISKRFVLLISGLKFHIWQVPRTNSFSGWGSDENLSALLFLLLFLLLLPPPSYCSSEGNRRMLNLLKKLLASDAAELVLASTIPAIVCCGQDLSAFLLEQS